MPGIDAGARSLAIYAGIDVPELPRLVSWVTIVDLGDGRVQFRSAEGALTLTQPVFVTALSRVSALLDGEHKIDEIASSAGAGIEPTTVLFLIKMLRANGLIQAGGPGSAVGDRRCEEFLSHFGDAAVLHRSLIDAHVDVVGGGMLADVSRSALKSAGIGRLRSFDSVAGWGDAVAAEPRPALLVAVADGPGYGFFDAVNESCLAVGIRWLRVCTQGTRVLLGPTVIPHQTACYACYGLREEASVAESTGYQLYRDQIRRGDRDGDEGMLAALGQIAAGQTAMEVMRLLTGMSPPSTIGKVYELTALSPKVIAEEVLRVPRCPGCGRTRVHRNAWDHYSTE